MPTCLFIYTVLFIHSLNKLMMTFEFLFELRILQVTPDRKPIVVFCFVHVCVFLFFCLGKLDSLFFLWKHSAWRHHDISFNWQMLLKGLTRLKSCFGIYDTDLVNRAFHETGTIWSNFNLRKKHTHELKRQKVYIPKYLQWFSLVLRIQVVLFLFCIHTHTHICEQALL